LNIKTHFLFVALSMYIILGTKSNIGLHYTILLQVTIFYARDNSFFVYYVMYSINSDSVGLHTLLLTETVHFTTTTTSTRLSGRTNSRPTISSTVLLLGLTT
jgi:hypothetical protein